MKKRSHFLLSMVLTSFILSVTAFASGHQHGIAINVDGVDYYLAGVPDGPNGAIDVPGHEWKQTDPNRLVGKHYNTGPFGASNWWAPGVADGELLFNVLGIIDEWTSGKALIYASRGFVHYQELVAVNGGAYHPTKVLWLKHAAVRSFLLDGGPQSEITHQVRPGVDYDFLPNANTPYSRQSNLKYVDK